MRPTSRGWATVLGGAATIVAGRAMGLRELYVLGAAAIALALGAAVWVGLVPIQLDVGRDVRPDRVGVGGSCRVTLTLQNLARWRTPVLVARDSVGTGERAKLSVAPLSAGEHHTLRYRLAAERRGVLVVGPMRLEVTDPFALARLTIPSAASVEVIVLPLVHPLRAVPQGPGDEPDRTSNRFRTIEGGHEEFATLRDYEQGDDVRLIHWPSTARLGRPVVRRFDEPWRQQVTVVLDVSAGSYDEASFERAVSAAASVVVTCWQHDEQVRLITSAGNDTGLIANEDGLDAAMNLLATVQPAADSNLLPSVRHVSRHRGVGTLVTVCGDLDPTGRIAVTTAGARFGHHVAISCTPLPAPTERAGRPTVEIEFLDDATLGRDWDAAMLALARRGIRTAEGTP